MFIYPLQSERNLNLVQLKQWREMSPQLAEFRARRYSTAQALSPTATDPVRVPPLRIEATAMTTPVASSLRERNSTTKVANCEQITPRQCGVAPSDRRMSAPSKLHPQRSTAAAECKETLPGKPERLSISPAPPSDLSPSTTVKMSVGQKHPLVATTKSVGHGQNVPLVTKQPQADQDSAPPYPDSAQQTKVATSKITSENNTLKSSDEKVAETADGEDVAAEEARKMRQAHQRLQKEKWQKKHGQGVKRFSEEYIMSSGEAETGLGAGALDENVLISAGEKGGREEVGGGRWGGGGGGREVGGGRWGGGGGEGGGWGVLTLHVHTPR